eukprot:g4728.t1
MAALLPSLDQSARPSHLLFSLLSSFPEAKASESDPAFEAWCRVRLLWDDAPKTCAAVCSLLKKTGAAAPASFEVMAVHGRHSGSEALCLTPEVIPLGDENTTLAYALGDVCFGFEPKGICQHATADASEIAWTYGLAVQPRRWVSKDGKDPTNQTPPFETVDVALNLFGKIEEEESFYAMSGSLPRTGERPMRISEAGPGSKAAAATAAATTTTTTAAAE